MPVILETMIPVSPILLFWIRNNRSKKYRLFQFCFFAILISLSGMHKAENMLLSQYSLRHSIPILISFIPVGLAYGILMQTSGYNWVWTGACSLFIFAGSLQFLAVSFFAGGLSLVAVTVMTLLLNSRHIFYGIPFMEQWKQYGPRKLFLIYALTDEAFSLHCSNSFDDGNKEHRMWSVIFDAMLVLVYWVSLSVIGAAIGTLIPFNTEGIDFALTALFIVILIEQLKAARGREFPALIAAVSSVVCLLVFGPSGFILPALMITVVLLMVFRKRILREEEAEHES